MQSHTHESTGLGPRRALLSGTPLTERRLTAQGAATAVLEGGDGPPVVLLHGQGAWAGVWLAAAPALVAGHRVVAPDLPGLGASEPLPDPVTPAALVAWLADLVEATCTEPPVVVALSMGGSLAARFTAAHTEVVERLVLVGAGGVAGRVRPSPRVLAALVRQGMRPNERTTVALLRHLVADLDAVRDHLRDRWDPFLAYLVALARARGVQRANRRLLRTIGLPAIPPEDLGRIGVPTTLVWGRHDRVIPVRAAQDAAGRHGWALHVVEDAGHLVPVDKPHAVVEAAGLGQAAS